MIKYILLVVTAFMFTNIGPLYGSSSLSTTNKDEFTKSKPIHKTVQHKDSLKKPQHKKIAHHLNPPKLDKKKTTKSDGVGF